ncbi:MAG: winged helix-turn-helix domain-containing protein [Candidatus Bathycorpusculaceae bacterium]
MCVSREVKKVTLVGVENVFSSKLRMKILKIIVRLGELNVSEIARRLSVNYETTIKHLKILEDEGILQHKVYGRIRLYRLNERSPKARAVQNLIDTWEHANKH